MGLLFVPGQELSGFLLISCSICFVHPMYRLREEFSQVVLALYLADVHCFNNINAWLLTKHSYECTTEMYSEKST